MPQWGSAGQGEFRADRPAQKYARDSGRHDNLLTPIIGHCRCNEHGMSHAAILSKVRENLLT
jgi:hypothetical protein